MKIRGKVTVILLAVALIPTLLIGYFILSNAEKALEVQLFRRLEIGAEFKVKMVTDLFQEQTKDLSFLQSSEVIRRYFPVLDQFRNDTSNPSYLGAKQVVDAYLSVMQQAFDFVDIMLINSAGEVVYVSNPGHKDELNLPEAHQAEYTHKLKAGFSVSGPYRSIHEAGAFVYHIVGPIAGSTGAPVGYVHAESSMSPIYGIIRQAISYKGSLEFLLAKQVPGKKIVFLSPLKEDPLAILKKTVDVGSNVAIPAQKAALGESGSAITFDYRGKKVLSVWRSIPALNWGLVGKVDVEEAFAPIKKLQTTAVLFIVIIVLVLLGVAFILARVVTRPIIRLQRGALEVGSGHWDQNIDIKAKDEVGDLARAFNDMARNLKWLMKKEKEYIMADALIEAEKQKADELRALNQQLTASEQQLKALNLQLMANEQQLRAVNQQLTAGEQQLKAANQQLMASEQELKAAKVDLEQKVSERTRELEQAKALLEVKVQERTRELQEKMDSFEKMNRLMVDRELRVIELKKDVNRLCKELGRPEPYGGVS
ncbi:MAG: HAMP domain-containing protein [Candidatus Omnitrophota bacterium]